MSYRTNRISHSSTITKEYLLTAATSKLVDFCIYIDPRADNVSEGYKEKVDNLRKILPMLCLNHTSYLGLNAQPISISMETKRSGDTEDNENLQMSTWQTAQWNYLRYVLTQVGGANHAKAAIDELGILPAIITNGHQWSFAATTQEDDKTVGIRL
jgi:hypothetical protein